MKSLESRQLSHHIDWGRAVIDEVGGPSSIVPEWVGGNLNSYHNYGHLLDVYEEVKDNGGDEAERIAALFHDFGYEPYNTDNIQYAVDVVSECLAETGKQHLEEEVVELILSTANHDEDNILVRADLVVLTTEGSVYGNYVKAIRAEYSRTSRSNYLKGRLNMMTAMKDMATDIGYFEEHEIVSVTEEIASLTDSVSKLTTNKKALYAGTFDPFHKGHLFVVRSAIEQGYEVVVAMLNNPAKKVAVKAPAREALIIHDLARSGVDAEVVKYMHNISVTGAMVENGCEVLLRGCRPGEVQAEEDRARTLKSEANVNTVLIHTEGLVSTYSSSAAKQLMDNYMPARMLTSVTRAQYTVGDRGPNLVLVVGGIACAKSTWCRLTQEMSSEKLAPTIDLDDVAKKYLAKHPVYGQESREQRLGYFQDMDTYTKYMQRVRPIIMAGLQNEIAQVSMNSKAILRIQVNKMGAKWEDLLRLCNYRVEYMEDITRSEALERVQKRGSSEETLEAVLNLERSAPGYEELTEYIRSKKAMVGNLTDELGDTLNVLTVLKAFNVTRIPQLGLG